MLRFRKDPARLLLVIVSMTAFAKGPAAAEPEDRPRLIRADPSDRIPGQYIGKPGVESIIVNLLAGVDTPLAGA